MCVFTNTETFTDIRTLLRESRGDGKTEVFDSLWCTRQELNLRPAGSKCTALWCAEHLGAIRSENYSLFQTLNIPQVLSQFLSVYGQLTDKLY